MRKVQLVLTLAPWYHVHLSKSTQTLTSKLACLLQSLKPWPKRMVARQNLAARITPTHCSLTIGYLLESLILIYRTSFPTRRSFPFRSALNFFVSQGHRFRQMVIIQLFLYPCTLDLGLTVLSQFFQEIKADTSRAPSYFSQFFQCQLQEATERGDSNGIRTLYIDRDPVTFADISRHLQGYHIEPRNGSHFVKLFADAQFYSCMSFWPPFSICQV